MTFFENHPRSIEEIRLRRTYRQLARQLVELRLHEQAYSLLRSELLECEQEYQDVVGARIMILRDLEWQVHGLLGGTSEGSGLTKQYEESLAGCNLHTTALLDGEDSRPAHSDSSIRSLYRDAARAFHPDLAVNDRERRHRQELMTVANEAYRTGDYQLLADLLSNRKSQPDDAGSSSGLELLLASRITVARQAIRRYVNMIKELKQSEIHILKQRVDDGHRDGTDLLTEMAARVDMDIERVRRRLFVLRGGGHSSVVRGCEKYKKRTIRFPTTDGCGLLYVRDASSIDYRDWLRAGAACGERSFSGDTSVRLDVKSADTAEPLSFDHLQSHDLQSLFLYNVDDITLARLSHLTGLQELYLSGARVSSDMMALLKPLQSLKRISLFHTPVGDEGILSLSQISGLQWLTCSGTAITEEGMHQFRRELPGCKAISFNWRYVR